MSKFVARYMTEAEFADWDQFVDQSEYGTIYHKTYWNKALYSPDAAVRISLVGVFNAEGKLAGGALLGWKRKFGKLKVVVPPYATCFSGLIIKERDTEFLSKSESYRADVLTTLLDFIEHEFHMIHFSLPPGFRDIRQFNWRGYRTNVVYTYRGAIEEREKLFESFLPALRRQIKKAGKEDFTIRREKDDKHAGEVYDLLKSSYQRQQHTFGLQKDAFVALLNNELLSENLYVYSIWKEDTAVAALVMVVDRAMSYYWLSGGDHHYFNTGLNQLLLLEVLSDLKEKGVTDFDFVGANTPSITQYKSGYNFQLVSYYQLSVQKGILARSLLFLKKLAKG